MFYSEWLPRDSFLYLQTLRFLFVRLDEKRTLQNKGGFTKRIAAAINKRDDRLRRTTRDVPTRAVK